MPTPAAMRLLTLIRSAARDIGRSIATLYSIVHGKTIWPYHMYVQCLERDNV
jgi:hypothetical protein